ncbi:MAG TPA: O-acetyl-ADP-ribose deacetylase [Jatrophihabitantaceae bacterium]|nr:O-acetyl-ADP-ribose deacetylase [Jatrophihabitantaceae bacterium]
MKLELAKGDITSMRVDAIVNAANSSLFGGGGVDGAIHKKGGRKILAACRELRNTKYPDGLPAGEAVHTTAGKLKARWVIHTVGPIYRRGDVETLRSCYRNSLAIAAELGATTVAFPLISAGSYGWPADDATRQAIDTISAAPNDGVATLVLFSAETFELAQSIFAGA